MSKIKAAINRAHILVDDNLQKNRHEDAIHRDLHSGNILYSQHNNEWYISDLGFCGPVNKSQQDIYGNLPYIAPEVICGKRYTFKSDIYSIGMLMWEISSRQPPFINYEHNYYLAMNIVNGMRPKIVSDTPIRYKNLMKNCWDADSSKRPDIFALYKEIREIIKPFISNNLSQLEIIDLESNSIPSLENAYESSRLFTSIQLQSYSFPEPRNVTEEEQEQFHSQFYSYNIPCNIRDLDKSIYHHSVKICNNSNVPDEYKRLKQQNKNIDGTNKLNF
ncbi:12665_t:CDS:2 [Funneliformis geosporum]|nr:12665_t:CDS:2 [Funneliformis geosporum]